MFSWAVLLAANSLRNSSPKKAFNWAGKPAWFLNYNGEPHWPLKRQNRKDFNIRMAQFFDHYLKGAPKPVWMERGVPAVEKGINQGYELLEEN